MSVIERRQAPEPAVAAGLAIAVCALASAGAAAVVLRSVARFTSSIGWYTIPALWPLLAGSLVAGVMLAARPRTGDRAGVVAFICAAQLLGGGVAASRDWFNVGGASGISVHRLAVVLPFTVVVVVAATITCCVASAVIWHRSTATHARWWLPVAPAYVVVGAITALVLPIAWAVPTGEWQVTTIGQVALTWSLPWGVGLVVAGWLDERSRRAARATIVASALSTVAVLFAMAVG